MQFLKQNFVLSYEKMINQRLLDQIDEQELLDIEEKNQAQRVRRTTKDSSSEDHDINIVYESGI